MIASMLLMTAMGLLLLAGVALALAWGATPYQSWEPAGAHARDPAPPPVSVSAKRYVRGVAVGLVGGFWAGALLTGPAMRLIMRLLAVTAGPGAQGRLTEAGEVIGEIDLDGTVGLYLFGGILPGLLSGALYVLLRRWLPAGRAGGVVFGALHLIVAATRVDPLRPGNPDFDLVGPGWLSMLTFGLAAVLHGMAVAAIANRYSMAFPPTASDRATRVRTLLPLVPPVLILIPGAFLLLPLGLGLALAVLVGRVDEGPRIANSRGFLLAGRAGLAAIALASLPGAATALYRVIVR